MRKGCCHQRYIGDPEGRETGSLCPGETLGGSEELAAHRERPELAVLVKVSAFCLRGRATNRLKEKTDLMLSHSAKGFSVRAPQVFRLSSLCNYTGNLLSDSLGDPGMDQSQVALQPLHSSPLVAE